MIRINDLIILSCELQLILSQLKANLSNFKLNIEGMSNTYLDQESGLVGRNFKQLSTVETKLALQKSLSAPKGADIFKRYYPGLDYLNKVQKDSLAIEKRGLQTTPSNFVTASDQTNTNYFGSNFASNNYLSLSKHPYTVEAAIDAATTFGVNSAGSPLAFGATKYYFQLKDELAEFWGTNTLIYSAGWLAGYGTPRSLIRQYDHIVIDEFADNSFFEGANAVTKSITKIRHLDEGHLAQVLQNIRSKDTTNAIMVITEGLFSLDSASPNLSNIQKLAKKHNAFLVIGCAHDFGIIGENGKGVWEEQNVDRSNVILVGTGSKTSSINFGFVGCQDKAVPDYMKYFSPAYMFTNAINPVQANSAIATLRIIRSEEGRILRKRVLANCDYLRGAIKSKGFEPLGRTSGFVCIRVGDQIISRMIVRILMDNEIHANNVEYPLAPLGQAVIRFSLNPDHTKEQMDQLVKVFQFAFSKSKEERAKSSPKL